MQLPLIEDFRPLFLQDVPLLDVRAPVEFADGSFPCASNLPLMNNDERRKIGIRYKEAGQEAAIHLGNTLATDEIKMQRIAAWKSFADQHPDGALYCFRGGMRSRIAQQWLFEHTGVTYPRIRGGYKALRRFLIDELEASANEIHPLVIGGRTGVGKTVLLRRMPNTLDLEEMAWHRGSAFGRHATAQPTAINFENALSIALIKHRDRGNPPLIVEDESNNIGARHLPVNLFRRFRQSPLIILEATVEERVETIIQEYIVNDIEEYNDCFGPDDGFQKWATHALESMDRVKRRLGSEGHGKLRTALETAICIQKKDGTTEAHRLWIRELLTSYYDPMYDYQMSKTWERVVFRGNAEEVEKYIRGYQKA